MARTMRIHPRAQTLVGAYPCFVTWLVKRNGVEPTLKALDRLYTRAEGKPILEQPSIADMDRLASKLYKQIRAKVA